MSVRTSNLGYPRIGEDRELKFSLEKYWAGKKSESELNATAKSIRAKNWQSQKDAGVDLIPSNDFSLYDHVLDTTCLVGAIPERFGDDDKPISVDTYFALARGKETPEHLCCSTHTAVEGVVAQTLHKWFNTNYHYLVPELKQSQEFHLSSDKPFREFSEALELNIRTKPVLLGPVSYLLLGRCNGAAFDRLQLLQKLLPVYGEILQKLRRLGAEWIQLDEPTLALDLDAHEQQAFKSAYERLRSEAGDLKILLGTYFGELRENLDVALSLPVDAIHLDAVEAREETAHAIDHIGSEKSISLGVVDGHNVWKNDLSRSLELLHHAKSCVGNDRLIISPSSSLLHVPYTVTREKNVPSRVLARLAFAREKLDELGVLRDALAGEAWALQKVECDTQAREERIAGEIFHPFLGHTESQLTELPRRASAAERRKIQEKTLNLPSLPTTTIGSFPQTPAIRSVRAKHRKGELSTAKYDAFVRSEIMNVIRKQEEIGLDVLVHGEPERTDMAEFFAERLDGMACTEYGWVQSFGSRYVRPPIIHDQVERKEPMTVELAAFAQSLSHKPVKGMLTGPVTLLHWSYLDDEQPAAEACSRLALAIRDEVKDLEAAGIRIIQIDEPALREGLPLRKEDQDRYLRWSTACFRLGVSGASPKTQIHTHTCYGDVRDILPILKDLDVDVISIEAARTRLAFLESINPQELPCDIGPGVWDIHSPRVPSVEELRQLIERARTYVPDDRLWINPDCGLKTRTPEQAWQALHNLVQATLLVRSSSHHE